MATNTQDLYSSTLSGNGGSITSGATSMKVAAAANQASGFTAAIVTGGVVELVAVTAGGTTTTWTITRAQGTPATTAASHNDGDTVKIVLTVADLNAWTIAGDVTGTMAASVVAKLQGQTLSASAVTKGQFLMGSAASSYGPISLSGDVTGSAATAGLITVTGLQSIAVPSPSGTNTILQYNSGAYTWAVGAGVSYTIQPTYGTNNQSITCTLNSLANSTVNVGRASTVVDNTSTLAEDVMLFLKIASNVTSGTAATGYVTVYGYSTADNGTTYTEGATGSDAGLTLTVPTNAPIIAVINVVANNKSYPAGPFSLRKAFGMDRVPQKWGIIVVNTSGATLAASGNSAFYQAVNGKLV